MNCPEVILFASDCHSIAMIQTGYLEAQRDRKNCGLPTRSCLPRLIYHRRALSKDLLLRAVTGTSFFTTGGESRIQSFSKTRRAAPSLCDGSVDSRAIVLKTRLSFLKPTRFTFSASIFRRATNQPAIQNRNTYVKWKEILVMPAQRSGEQQQCASHAAVINDARGATAHRRGT